MYTFSPKNGAPIDLPAIESIANRSSDILTAYLGMRWGETLKGAIITGLEPNGKRPKKSGPPGVMQFSVSNFVLSEGVAIVPLQGKPIVCRFEEAQVVQMEEPEKSQHKRAIVLSHTAQQAKASQQQGLGAELAHQVVHPMILVVNQDAIDEDNMTVIANELAPNIWSTDVARMVSMEHPLVQTVISLLDKLEDVVWESDSHGQPWQVQRLGREWKTYQSKASVAITGARLALSMKPTVTQERVRVLTNLHWQLQRSVEQGAQQLANWVGVLEAADQYAPVFSAPPVDWDEM